MANAILWIPALLTGIGVLVLTRVGLVSVVPIGEAVMRRLRARVSHPLYSLLTRGQEAPSVGEVTKQRKGLAAVPVAVWGCMGAGLLLAAAWHHWLLSPWFIALGLACGWILISTRSVVGREGLKELETFIASLKSIFVVGQSVFGGLETAAGDLDEGPLQTAVLEAVRRFGVDSSASRALNALKEMKWRHLTRLAVILENVGFSDDESIRKALSQLELAVRRTRELRNRARTALTLTRLTLRFLQVANLGAVIAVTVLPMWRGYYVVRPLAMMAATGLTVAGSWYFANELRRIEGLL